MRTALLSVLTVLSMAGCSETPKSTTVRQELTLEQKIQVRQMLLEKGLLTYKQSPLIGRKAESGMRELVISCGRSGYVALYRYVPNTPVPMAKVSSGRLLIDDKEQTEVPLRERVEVTEDKPAVVDHALPFADRRRHAHGAAADEQRRTRCVPGAGSSAGGHAVASHEFDG